MIAFAWIILLGLMTLLFSRYLDSQNNPNQSISSTSTAEMREVILQRNRYGHYVATGSINGTAVEFMLDTGATMVSVPQSVARRLQLERGPGFEVVTANGTVTVFATTLDQVSLGSITLHDIRASINPHMEDEEILLGMSFLKHLEFTQQGEQLILRQY